MSYYVEVTEAVKKYIENNLEQGVSPDDTAKAANYSLKQLSRIFSLVTGLTIGEYIRWKKLTKALFELKYNDEPIIDIAFKYGYESQEAFTRAFKDNFSLTPGEYRKTKCKVTARNWHINQFIHQTAHDFLDANIYKRENVESWIITKPDRIWAAARKNTEKLHPADKFFALCEREGIMEKTGKLPNVITTGGAYRLGFFYSCQLSFGVEVEEDYPLDLLSGFEVVHIPQSKYVVFNCPAYPIENHGDVVGSTWKEQKDYDVEAQGLQWAFDKLPVFEEDNEETGYTLWFPVKEKLQK